MQLVEFVRQETGVDFSELALLRHFNSIDRLIELGGSVEEFTYLQPKDTKWDFWRVGKPKIQVLVVIVHDRVFGVFRVHGVEAEGTFNSLASGPLRKFDEERDLYPERPTRRFILARIPSATNDEAVTGWEGREINAIVRNNAELFSAVQVSLVDGALRLTSQEAEGDDASSYANYSPQEGDRRRLVERQIRERRGQRVFRDALLKRYSNCCLVTRCDILAVLEAAHISPYRGDDDNHPQNGLLLRSDIHTLFDLDLLGIEPERLFVELHPDVAAEYGRFLHVALGCDSNQQPSREALRLRFEQFCKRLQRPA